MEIRNVAISGVDTQEKYEKVCRLCGDTDIDIGYALEPKYSIVYDDGSINENSFMYNWDMQDYSHCTLYTYEEFIAKYDKKQQMKVYTAAFDGCCIVGVALVIANSKEEAMTMLNTKLETMSLDLITIEDVKEHSTDTPSVTILLNGDY